MKRLIVMALALAACAPQAAHETPLEPPSLALAWRAEGLANPESVALSADGSFFYVSNVAGEGDAKDGAGFIARIGRDGRMLQRDWAAGLDAPKGLALSRDALFVSDIDRLVMLDAQSGAIIQTIPIPGAVFLNDVAIAPDGAVLLSDSGAGRLYAVRDGRPEIWAEDRLLRSVNGLLVEPSRLLITTMQGRFLSMDWRTKAISEVVNGLGDGDGVAPWGGGYFVSDWRGRMFFVRDGRAAIVLDARAEGVLLNDFMIVGDMLIAPHWAPGALSAYRIGAAAR